MVLMFIHGMFKGHIGFMDIFRKYNQRWFFLEYLQTMKKDLIYSKKVLCLVFYKFVCLQAQNWENNYDNLIWENIDKDNTWCNSYYVCALFSNGKHLPLPLVLKSNGEYWLQNIVLSVIRWLGFLKQAEKACREYQKEFEKECFIMNEKLVWLVDPAEVIQDMRVEIENINEEYNKILEKLSKMESKFDSEGIFIYTLEYVQLISEQNRLMGKREILHDYCHRLNTQKGTICNKPVYNSLFKIINQ
jgi:hypothetical protein